MKRNPTLTSKVAQRWADKLAKNPRSINDWQIFSKPGAGAAAKALTVALKKSQAVLLQSLRSKAYKDLEPDWEVDHENRVAKLIGKVYSKVLYPVMSKFTNFGATDTEPRYVAAQALIDTAKNFYGISGFTNLGDYI